MAITLEVFTAPWCSKCKALKPLLDDIRFTTVEINVDEDEGAELASQRGVGGLPAINVTTGEESLGLLSNIEFTVDGIENAVEELVQ